MLGMLNNHHAALIKQVIFKYLVYHGLEFLLGGIVGWVGDNNVVGRFMPAKELQHIAFNGRDVEVKLRCRLLDEFNASEVGIYSRYGCRAARPELIAQVTSAGEQVEHFQAFKVEPVVQDIEQRFFRHVCCWPYRQSFGRAYPAALVFSGNDPHELNSIKCSSASCWVLPHFSCNAEVSYNARCLIYV